ncbi:MAG: S1 RNA-binding domain-containing protein [Candidatus Jacksonbacteria bacterium]|jgi:small subunit ribosomal protein S1|nr:S1 RNA-binding domain-containing protein [Candidatus Jacksonbacteria bacterium]MBT6034550.1 S1 RNA-binding domain-containing protein [Candidatus Jacksonbacteria bacterium]MBT6300992.1 S1 RNA-binding domain-containing protein [Candidatus Jacksonbacteria bacterium]MBT6756910.1 S1 RNA-binding domain-containing protein [Candidatus Jacksonbacteria bacterium]MBT6955446.1 S1 RNA-binding domain-containing protein [Candidatus Jacksonbacteria bacterium]
MALIIPANDNKNDEMDALLDKHPQKLPNTGDVIDGVVLSIGKNEILVDINGVLTGIVRGNELQDEMGEHETLETGDTITVTVVDKENERGLIELSLKEAIHQRAWDNLRELETGRVKVAVTVVDANKGGLIVKVGGVIGFLPVSQLTTEHYPRVEGGDKNKILDKLKSFVGQKMDVKVITVDEPEEKLIVSEKAAWEDVQKERISQYTVGDTVKGVISGIVDFGCFVKFGDGLEGLVHISEMAWQRVDNPRDIVKVGDEVKVKIIEINATKIFLSFKQLEKDPWAQVADTYHVGQLVKGKIVKINPYGLFVELGDQLQGLCHVSEITADKSVPVTEKVQEGGEYEFKILNIEPENRRIGLSMKELEETPEETKTNSDNDSDQTEEESDKTSKETDPKDAKKEKESPAEKTADAKDAKEEKAEKAPGHSAKAPQTLPTKGRDKPDGASEKPKKATKKAETKEKKETAKKEKAKKEDAKE